ncbi:hypothetical protein AX16_002418 [Volvariella volvacea WC 439]|nr:hypothetical protein AX16_002418 [Volvariella volvacea WC 439]
MAQNLDSEENLLEAALLQTQAFVLPPADHQPSAPSDQPDSSAQPTLAATSSSEKDEPPSSAPVADSSAQDTWKAEYESQVQSWRAQSAEARQKAEKDREHWEQIRLAEKQAGVEKPPIQTGIPPPPVSESGWDALSDRASVSIQREGAAPADNSANKPVKIPLSQAGIIDESSKWEEVESSSSLPSMSFPEGGVKTPPPPRRTEEPSPAPLPPPTLTIFDSSLPTRTRVNAFLSSLAINLLLPFVNGVMLGFGEIFAKNVVMGWLGWNAPGSSVSNVGLGHSTVRRRQSR